MAFANGKRHSIVRDNKAKSSGQGNMQRDPSLLPLSLTRKLYSRLFSAALSHNFQPPNDRCAELQFNSAREKPETIEPETRICDALVE